MKLSFLAMTLAFLMGTGLCHADDTAPSDPQPVAQVTTAPLRQATLHRDVVAYGSVDAAADRSTAIGFPFAGQITALFVSAGKTVRRNEPLFELTPDPAATLSYRQAVSSLALAKSDLARTRQQLAEHLATNAQVDTVVKALHDAQAAVDAQTASGGGQARIIVRAPYNGTVTTMATALGDRVAAGTTIMDVAASTGLVATLGVEPAESRQVKLGMVVTLAGLQNGSASVSATGAIANIGGAIEPKNGLVIAIVTFRPNAVSFLSGERVRGAIAVETANSLAAPRQAVLSDDRGAYLFQAVDGKAKRVDVKPGLESDGLIGVAGDLDTASPVVTEGNYELAEGMAIATADPAATKGGDK